MNLNSAQTISWMSYWLELRRRVFYCLISLAVIFALCFFYSRPLYHVVALPLLRVLPTATSFIATQVATPLLTPLKLAWLTALLITLPIIFYHVWRFVMPALYPQEKRRIWPLLGASLSLFYSGMAFAYFVVFPLIFRFFINITPATVKLMPDMGQYLDFVWQLLWAFGLAFEVPVVIFVLITTRIVSIARLRSWRPYIIVAAFTVGMLLTPPDVISQVLLAVPLWLLYEVGLFFGTCAMRR